MKFSLLIVFCGIGWCALAGASEPVWMQDLKVLADDSMEGREVGSKGSKRSREFLIQRYADIGIEPLPALKDYGQPFSAVRKKKPLAGTNVVGQLTGTLDRYIVVSAHYDHIGRKGRRIFNGADDNASGVAAMLCWDWAAKTAARVMDDWSAAMGEPGVVTWPAAITT